MPRIKTLQPKIGGIKQHRFPREKTAARGYGARWQRARLQFLAQHPLCRECQSQGRVTVATVVDHVRPHKGDQVLFWDRLNWAPACAPCHNRKTAACDGGFGNARSEGQAFDINGNPVGLSGWSRGEP